MCTFTDKEIDEYIRHKQNIFHETYPRSIKRAVRYIQMQCLTLMGESSMKIIVMSFG